MKCVKNDYQNYQYKNESLIDLYLPFWHHDVETVTNSKSFIKHPHPHVHDTTLTNYLKTHNTF